jgi:hypothetical protein
LDRKWIGDKLSAKRCPPWSELLPNEDRVERAIPPSMKRDGCGSRKFREASLAPQTGWSSEPKHVSMLDHPVRSASEASPLFVYVAATLLIEEGNRSLTDTNYLGLLRFMTAGFIEVEIFLE